MRCRQDGALRLQVAFDNDVPRGEVCLRGNPSPDLGDEVPPGPQQVRGETQRVGAEDTYGLRPVGEDSGPRIQRIVDPRKLPVAGLAPEVGDMQRGTDVRLRGTYQQASHVLCPPYREHPRLPRREPSPSLGPEASRLRRRSSSP